MRRLVIIGLVMLMVLVSAFVLTGCSSTEVREEPGTQPAVTPQPTPAPEQVQQEEKVIISIINNDPASLDPINPPQARELDYRIASHVAQPLFATDNLDRTLQPLLAESADVSSDGMTWTIKLRQGISFHDGLPFNAEAAKLNLDRIRHGGAVVSRHLNDYVDEVEVADEYTIKLHMSNPTGLMLYNLSETAYGMVSPSVIEGLDEGESYEFPIGTGPYRFVKWDRGEQIVMEKVEDYWGEPAKNDRVIFKPVPEAGSRSIMLETGEGHIAMGIPTPEAERLKQNPDVVVRGESFRQMFFIGLNNSKPPFDNKLVRQAVNYAVDKQAIVDTILMGGGRVATSPVPQGCFGYKTVGPYEYDPEKARQLLAEAGYGGGGVSVDLYHPTGVYMMDAMVAEAVQAYLNDVGIEVNLVTAEFATLMQTIRKPMEESVDDMYLLGWSASHPDAHFAVENILHSAKWPPQGGTNNYYKNERVDELIDLAASSNNMQERERYYHELQEIVWEDAPWLFLHEPTMPIAHHASLEGVFYNRGFVFWNVDWK